MTQNSKVRNGLYESMIPSIEQVIYEHSRINQNLEIPEISDMYEILKLSTMMGRFKEGHYNMFQDKSKIKFPETNIKHLTDCLGLQDIRFTTNLKIKEFIDTLDEMLLIVENPELKKVSNLYDPEKKSFKLVNKFGGTLFSNDFLRRSEISEENLEDFLRGVYIGSQMDSVDKRQETIEYYPKNLRGDSYEIGGGHCYPVNLEKLLSHKNYPKYSIKNLETKEWTEENIEEMKNMFIESKKKLELNKNSDSNIINLYIRTKKGLGCTDDASLIMTAVKEYIETEDINKADAVYLGMVAIDTVDTIDKISLNLVDGGADEYIGEHLNKRYKKIKGRNLAENKEIYSTIYLGAKNNLPTQYLKPFTLSSSVKYFSKLQKDKNNKTEISAYELHRAFILNGKEKSGFKFAYDNVKSNNFYRFLNCKLDAAIENYIIRPKIRN